jgi:hypothetical protein
VGSTAWLKFAALVGKLDGAVPGAEITGAWLPLTNRDRRTHAGRTD